MKVEIEQLILNEKQVVEEMIEKNIIPDFYNSYVVGNRLYRYFNGDVKKVVEQLEKLGIKVKEDYVKEMFENYTEIQPLSQDKSIKIYKSELDKIKKLKSRQTQRTVFGLLMFKKIINEKYGLIKDNMLRLDSIDEIFNYVNNIENTKAERQAWYDMQQNGIINVDWDCNIELKILEFDGETVETIKNKFDDCKYWFDKLIPAEELETIVAVLPDGTVEIYEHMGYRGTAREFSEKHFEIKNTRIKDCCSLVRKHYKKVIFFVLDEEQCLEDMIKERQDLLKKKSKKQ
jgi:hypothetical protein